MLVFGQDDYVSEWVSIMLGKRNWGYKTAIGIQKNDFLIAGVVYNNQMLDCKGKPFNIEMSIASVDKSWCNRHNLGVLFRYPFIQLGVKRVQATTAKRNKSVRQFLDRLGFTLEGIGRQAWPEGGDCAVYSMLKPECKWIK